MHLVVLPGLDGTGILLETFAKAVRPWCPLVQVIRYPVDQALGYGALEAFVRERLPTGTPFVLLGESFSGPLSIRIAAAPPPGLRGLVLSTTFDHQPVEWMAGLAPLLSIPPVRAVPMAVLSWALLGRWGTPELLGVLARALDQVAPAVLRARAQAALRVDVRGEVPGLDVPMLYLRGTGDRLLATAAGQRIVDAARDARLVDVPGPHLLLQAQAVRCAEVIGQFVESLTD